MTTQILKTNERTINKNVRKQIISLLLPEQKITTVTKKHVPECGYVFYFQNEFGVTMVNACKEDGQITLRYKR